MKANHNFTPPFLLPLTNPLCMVVCQLPLVLASTWGKVSALVGCIRLLYSTNWANYATLPRDTTQNTPQHTTTNMSRPRPTHQWLWSSLSMATSAMDLYLGATALYGSEAGAGRLVRSHRCQFSRLERQKETHQKIERCVRLLP